MATEIDRIEREKFYKHIRTCEDWYGTLEPYEKSINSDIYYNNTLPYRAVGVSVIELNMEEPKNYRVCIWGTDDFGLEKDYLTRIEAFELFHSIKDYTTKKHLKDIGFVNA